MGGGVTANALGEVESSHTLSFSMNAQKSSPARKRKPQSPPVSRRCQAVVEPHPPSAPGSSPRSVRTRTAQQTHVRLLQCLNT